MSAGNHEEDNSEVVVCIDRTLDLKVGLPLTKGTKVWALKKQLAEQDPTGQAEASSFKLRLLTPSGKYNILRDDDLVPKDSGTLELWTPPSAEAQTTAAAEAQATAVPTSAPPPAALDGPVDLALAAGTFEGLVLEEGCTVGQWRKLLGSGALLGDKVLYAEKLRCRAVSNSGEVGPTALGEKEQVPRRPQSMAVTGPDSVLRSLDCALQKKLGKPNTQRQPSVAAAEAAAVPALPLRAGGGQGGLEFFYLGLQGHRATMEDRACATLNLCAKGPDSIKGAAFFGVFDGHGGDQVADLTARHLPGIVARELAEGGDPAEALKRAFSVADRSLREALTRNPHALDLIGTTAVVVLLLPPLPGGSTRARLLCANCGDSRAVLCRRSGRATDLSRDHKAEDPAEAARIEAAGGSISRGRISMPGGDGGLNLSRALGDFAYKQRTNQPEDCQLVIPCPEVETVELEEGDDFVVLGSDGVFDALTSEELVTMLREAMDRGESAAQAVEKALQKVVDSGDNVTLCLARLPRSGGWPSGR